MRAALALLVAGALPGLAHASTVIGPADGAVVPSLPAFVFEGIGSGASWEVEYAADPALRTESSHAGFHLPLAMAHGYAEAAYEGVPVGSHSWVWDGRRINAGTYHWHALIDDYGDDNGGRWSAVRRFTVRDEAPLIESWTARVVRLRGRPGCRQRRHVLVRFDYDENSLPGAARASLRVFAGERVAGRWYRRLEHDDQLWRISRAFCSRLTEFKVRLAITDPAGQFVTVERVVAIGAAPAVR